MRPPSPKFTFQLATADDAPALAALHTSVAAHLTAQHGRGHWSLNTTEKGVLFALRNAHVYTARLGNELVGTLNLARKKPWAIDTSYFATRARPLYLVNMAIVPEKQRQGLGRRCLQEAIRVAREFPTDAIRLDAYDGPAGAGGFYASCGFTEAGRASFREQPLIYYELLL